MGKWYQTNFARLLSGKRISVYDALELLKEDKLTRKLKHITEDVPVKFVPSKTGERVDYFAVVNRGNMSKEVIKNCKESTVHKFAKEILLNMKKYDIENIVLDGRVISQNDIKSVSAEERITIYKKYIIPDITLVTDTCTYYIEVKNTHGLTKEKIALYKSLQRKMRNVNFKVIEIDVSDIAEMSYSCSYEDIEKQLISRIIFETRKKTVIDLSDKKPFVPFGKCFCCDSELELVNNVADPEKSTLRGLSGFKSVKLINPVAEYTGDCTSLGSAVLHCPNCSEGRYTQILCPECLKKGYSVPLKLLYNPRCGGKKEQFILQCQRYVSVEDKLKQERKQGYLIPLSKICDFCINILEEDGITPTDELQAVGGLSEMSKNWARSKRKLMHLRESLKETEKD